VLGAVDRAAGAVLRFVDLRFFGAGELAAVRLAIGADLLVNALFPIFQTRGLRRF
jgi:hypothetical protein